MGAGKGPDMDTKEIQEGEIEVLKSIFMEDFQLTESKTAWKTVNAAHEFRILVRPLEEELKDKVGIRLHFKLPAKYPRFVPSISLEDPFGLTSTQLSSLQSLLSSNATQLIGSEMIYELCSIASGFITDRNGIVEIERGKGTSLGDERKRRGEEEEKATREARVAAELVRMQKDEEEVKRLSQMINEDVKRKEELRLERLQAAGAGENEDEGLLEIVGGERRLKMKFRDEKGDEEERRVKVGLCESGDYLGRWLPAEIMIGQEYQMKGTVGVFDILAPYFLSHQGKRKLLKVTSDLIRLLPLRHPHLLPLHSFLLTSFRPSFFPTSPYSTPSSRFTSGWTLLVLTLPRPPSLESLLSICGELKPEKAVNYLSQLSQVVEYIHSNNAVHKSIRINNVLIDPKDGGVKLSNTTWWQRLVDLNKSDKWVEHTGEDEFSEAWTCPGAVNEPFLYDRSRDMWDVGVVFAQMVFGIDVVKRYPTPRDLVHGIPRDSTVRRILHDLLLTEVRKRPSASRLLTIILESSTSTAVDASLPSSSTAISTTPQNSAFQHFPQHFKSGLPPTPLFSPSVAAAVTDQISKSVEGPQGGFFWQPKQSGSRYRSEFEELEFLGRGGGGQVVKARNRLDGHLYAVKKIRLPNNRAAEEKILREVTIWSRMNHPNIVRYHTSWREEEQVRWDSNDDGESTQPTATETASTQPEPLTTSSDDADAGDVSSNSDPSDFDEDDSSLPGDDLDIDLGLDDLDNSDFLSIGHSKSVSYPMIHFGNEDDESRVNSAVNSSPVLSKNATRATSPIVAQTPKQIRMLYIQMEYVEKLTLKEAIEDGESEVDSWRHMFQILSAMLHFTSLNIIHRDLKPSNIFIDVKGDVRIGDFGLAVNQGLADPSDVLLSVDSSMEEIDLTSGVGTSLYIAPETLSRARTDRHVKYSNKIDMYSLGIVFFELWHPFKTGMERIQVLRDLRKPEIIFPPTWDKTKLARHTKIVERCLAHDPELRASPKDLLNSDLLPPRVGDDSIEETIRLLSHSGTQHAQTLITALFNQTDEDRMRKDFSYDFYDGEGAKVDNDPYGEIVREKLSRIFRQKGAVCMDSPLLMPQSQIYGSRKPVRLLDADGTIACLPYQLNIPFCRMVARDTSLTRLKRWTIAPVYRTSTAGGQPRAVLNAAFDIVTDAITPATEAECLFVIEEIMAAFPFAGETVHVLNHAKILDALVERFPVKRRPAVLEVLVQHGRLQRQWNKTATELLKIQGVTRQTIEEVSPFSSPGKVSSVRELVLSAAPRLKHVVQEAFDELEEVIALGKQMGVRNIQVAPLLATNWDFHRDGVFFETRHVKGRMHEAVVAGGRFDDVVLRLAAPDIRYSGRCPHVVGFSLSVAMLSLAAADSNSTSGKALLTHRKEELRSYGAWAVRRCDVYVVSFAPNLVETRLEIVKDLWKAGIKADLMYDDNFLTLSPEKLLTACRREGILWLIFVKQGADRKFSMDESEKTLKVKSVLRGEEAEVPRSEITSWIMKESREQALIDERHATGSAGTAETLTDSLVAVPESRSNQEYFPILQDEDVRHKGKHKQRTILIHRAQKNVDEAVITAAEAPVFAIDIDGEAFRKMVDNALWITDDNSFRTIVQNASPAKRDYLHSIRRSIRQHHSRTPFKRFWLFSLRDDKSSLLTFDEGL